MQLLGRVSSIMAAYAFAPMAHLPRLAALILCQFFYIVSVVCYIILVICYIMLMICYIASVNPVRFVNLWFAPLILTRRIISDVTSFINCYIISVTSCMVCSRCTADPYALERTLFLCAAVAHRLVFLLVFIKKFTLWFFLI